MNLIVLLLTLGVYIIRPGDWVGGEAIRWNLILNVAGSLTFLVLLLNGRAKESADRTWGYIFGFFALMLVSSILHGYFIDITNYYSRILTIILVYLLICACIQHRAQLNVLTIYFLALTLFVVWQCHVQIQTGFNIADIPALERRTETSMEDGFVRRGTILQARWVGVFQDPNDVGLLFVMLTPFAAAKALFIPGNLITRLPWAATATALIYGIYLTNSRGTFVALLAATGYFFILKYRSTMGLVLAAVGGFALLTLGPSRMSSLTSGDDSAMERVYIWIEALWAFSLNPVLGLGPMHWGDWHHMTTHNSYVHAFVENGFFAFVCYLALFLIPLFIISAIAFNEDDKRLQVESAAMGSCLAGVMMSIFFISRTYVVVPYFMAAYVLTYTRVVHRAWYEQFIEKATIIPLTALAALFVVFVWITNVVTTRLML